MGAQKGRGPANRLLALSSAAVLTVYSAGYLRTRAAADKLQASDRGRVVIPAAPGDLGRSATMLPPLQPAPPSVPAARLRARSTDAASARPKKAQPHQAIDATTPDGAVNAAPVETALAATPVATNAVAATPVPTPTPVAEPAPTPTPQASAYKDGTYSGWGTSRHGDIEATVVISGGRITSALITQCLTRYSCSWVAHLQGQVVARQSPEVDYVSGATQSTNAFYYAVVQALSKAK